MSKILYDTKFLQLKSTPSKSGKPWVYAHRPNAKDVVVILPVIEGDKILFLKEERPPLQAEGIAQYSIALPAGLVGDEREGESVEDAIRAELLEEAGLVADRIEIKSRKIASSPGCVSETITIAIAFINKYEIVKTPVNDGGVIADRILVNRKDVYSWLTEQEASGMALTGQTLAALFYLNEKENI